VQIVIKTKPYIACGDAY